MDFDFNPPPITELTPTDEQVELFAEEYVKDFKARRAAKVSGYSPDDGHRLLDLQEVKYRVQAKIHRKLQPGEVTPEWLLSQLVDNHFLARQEGKISASNTALDRIAKHNFVDAYAAAKVEVTTDKDLMDALHRGRQRVAEQHRSVDAVESVKEDISFL